MVCSHSKKDKIKMQCYIVMVKLFLLKKLNKATAMSESFKYIENIPKECCYEMFVWKNNITLNVFIF